ncbi:EamA family transporter [Saccharopolyspora sp. WRP15-2]|uniref:EamA family transporter n=1 Tax=Saccharopolyspora oryzae TaxID=2997343 RepID=A0ABT4UVF5_9PSEU|nr:EamA family transporter [Saccharopolyspora oryzae]MDA3625688.1 EamA family transporter [Saccharopolyspora oryzae]
MRAARGLAHVPAPGLVLGGVVSLQCGAAVATNLFPVVGVMGVVSLRLSFAAVLLMLWWRPGLRYDRRTWGLVLLVGSTLTAHHIAFFEAVDRVPLGVATSVEFLGPLAVALVGSSRALDVLWALLAAVGVVALTGDDGNVTGSGLLFAAVAGVCWGVYIVVSATLVRRLGDSRGLALAMCWGAFLTLPYGVGQVGSALLSPGVLALGILVALMSSVLSYSLQMEALRRMSRGLFGVLASLEPAVGALVGLLLLGQVLSAEQTLGVLAVVGASLGATRTRNRRRIS